MAKFQIADLNSYSKPQFKKIVKNKIIELNKSKLLEVVRNRCYKKIDHNQLSDDDFMLKPYMRTLSVADARTRFRIASKMTLHIKMKFQSDSRFAQDLSTCEGCRHFGGIGYRDTQQHVLICPAYLEFRKDKDLSNDKDLVNYFKLTLAKRVEAESWQTFFFSMM